MIGKTLGHYQITNQLGKGGMGEVYQAKDQKLGRDVAIKVLPEEFAKDADRVARFQREAKVLASLNHPNIAAIHGLEESNGTNFLVLELVEGETLADRLKRGPIPVEESLKLALQIAEALEAAHEKGAIHRDLKPANIKVTPDGKVKVLDFGLAKAFAMEQSELNLSNSPTLSNAATQQGIILGTAAYMSPEQAKGKSVDKRADIWAFGCILYECLTGKRAFEGETVTETLAAVLKSEPGWDLLSAVASWEINSLVRRCLQKDPKERLHDIADARIAIGQPATQIIKAISSHRRLSPVWLLALCAALTFILGISISPVLMRYFQPAPAAPLIITTIKVEPGHWLADFDPTGMQRPSRTAMAISSDGRFMVYSASPEFPLSSQPKPQLYLRRMEESGAKPIVGTEEGMSPFMSPDDRWVGFSSNGKLKKIPVAGGVATSLCDASLLYGASWGRDGSIVFANSYDGGLLRISAEGGEPETLTSPDPKRGEFSHRLPFWLPNSKAVLFTIMRHSGDSQPRLALIRLDTREWNTLLDDAADGRYVPTGQLIFLRRGTLMAVRFDIMKLQIIGRPIAIVEDIMQSLAMDTVGANTGAGQFSISEAGSLIFVKGGIGPDPKNSLVWVNQKGVEQPVTALQFPFFAPRLSPDGRRIAYSTLGRERQVWVYDLGKGTNSRLTSDAGGAGWPIWSHDGKRILFESRKSLAGNLFWQPYDGSSPMERLTKSESRQIPGSCFPDGKTVALVDLHDTGNYIALLDLNSRTMKPFLNSKFNETHPEVSPDGRWIAYCSDESKRNEIYVRPVSGSGPKYQVSSQGGSEPLWARNDRQLFYRWQEQVWVVDVQVDGSFMTSKPRLLFEKLYAGGNPGRGWDLSLDGQRFLMVRGEEKKLTAVNEITFVQNWFEELRRLAPTRKK